MRSGASSIPELLRLAPNLQVAQVSANSYAITARGFNGTTANKLLVLIDGRSVYTPLFSGVFWDVQAVMPEDIDRIEVISGPGATLWGPNAVNGVINIITRKSRDTLGAMVTVEPGDFENSRAAALWRHDRRQLSPGAATAWVSTRDNTVSTMGVPRNDSWHNLQGGARVDWSRGADALTFQGDINEGEIDQRVPADQQLAGHNLLGRWTRRFDERSELQVQALLRFFEASDTGRQRRSRVCLRSRHPARFFTRAASQHRVGWRLPRLSGHLHQSTHRRLLLAGEPGAEGRHDVCAGYDCVGG